MKQITILLLLITYTTFSQINPEIAKSAINIEMLFPEGKNKALILSYDDGAIQDRKLVDLMNKYHLIGTFHLNSNKLGSNKDFNYLKKEEKSALDVIAIACEIPTSKAAYLLLNLELKGVCRPLPGKEFELV